MFITRNNLMYQRSTSINAILLILLHMLADFLWNFKHSNLRMIRKYGFQVIVNLYNSFIFWNLKVFFFNICPTIDLFRKRYFYIAFVISGREASGFFMNEAIWLESFSDFIRPRSLSAIFLCVKIKL